MHPTSDDVMGFLGRGGDETVFSLAEHHLPIVTQMVKAYTRDRGFDPVSGEPGEDLAAVIVSCVARQMANPEHQLMVTIDDYTTRRGVFNGWTLPELAILHRYRKRAM